MDWIYPEAWSYEHNALHHYNTGQKSDPDQVERLFKVVRTSKISFFKKDLYFWFMAFTWKITYYAPSTFLHLKRNSECAHNYGYNHFGSSRKRVGNFQYFS